MIEGWEDDEGLEEEYDDIENMCQCGCQGNWYCDCCGAPLCHRCHEVGAGFCNTCPTLPDFDRRMEWRTTLEIGGEYGRSI